MLHDRSRRQGNGAYFFEDSACAELRGLRCKEECKATWLLIFGCLGLFHTYCNSERRFWRYFSDSSYWMYLAHLPIQFQMLLWIGNEPWYWPIKFLVYVFGTLAVLLPSYHFLVRPTWIGWLLNGKMVPLWQGDSKIVESGLAKSAPEGVAPMLQGYGLLSSGIRQEFRFVHGKLAHPKVLATSATLKLATFKGRPGRITQAISSMSQVTQILNAIEAGDQQAAGQLLPLVYDELRKLAKSRLVSEKPGQTLQATDLVHEAYRRLVEVVDGESPRWNSTGHFFAAAAEAMRRILIDRARARTAQKRGGELQRVELDEIDHPAARRPEKLLELDEALTKLEQQDMQKAQLIKLRFFAGLTTHQAAAALGISPATADRHWAFARAWLKTEMES